MLSGCAAVPPPEKTAQGGRYNVRLCRSPGPHLGLPVEHEVLLLPGERNPLGSWDTNSNSVNCSAFHRTRKIIALGPAMPNALECEQPQATGSSPDDQHWGHLVLPVGWVAVQNLSDKTYWKVRVWQGWDKEDSCEHLQRQRERERAAEKENSRKWAVTRGCPPTRLRIRVGSAQGTTATAGQGRAPLPPPPANWEGVTSACSWLEFLLALGFLSMGRGSWPESFKPGEQWPSHHPCSPSSAGCCSSAPDRRWIWK
ncbi:uncharacterized protein LOC108641176 [Manacus vitellinus]|uniref:uncharacterized protein LOC108641176 n=1 Tax=Manacus vitellinus TaxID=328815 RepID=UPI00115F3614|nr:uncharacterized protein LOC108641176 [Manacus vitellinus]